MSNKPDFSTWKNRAVGRVPLYLRSCGWHEMDYLYLLPANAADNMYSGTIYSRLTLRLSART